MIKYKVSDNIKIFKIISRSDNVSKYKYKIAETTREQRAQYAKEGELSRLGGSEPSEFVRQCSQDYVDGKMELADVKAKVIAHYKRV
jgi:hypothetical protein